MTPNQPFRLQAVAVAVAAACCSFAAQAQSPPAAFTPPVTPPSAGQVLRELQTPPAALPQALPAARAEATADSPDSGVRVLVKSVVITGNQEVATADLMPLVASLVGAEQTVSQLNAAARRITSLYRSRGFAVARALLPAQDITSGAVTIAVIEGRIASSRLVNTTVLPDAVVNSYIADVKPGDVIRSAQIDRGLLLLQDTPGIASSRATLQPGASVGTSELVIEVTPAARLAGSVTLDNYGSRYTGEYRLGANLAVASPLGLGDQFSASALTSGQGLKFARAAYAAPLGSDGLRAELAYFATRYELGREFAALDASGRAGSTRVSVSYPFVRSAAANLSGGLSFESKRLNDQVNATATVTDKTVGITRIGLSGNRQDALGGGGLTTTDVSLGLGKLNIDSPSALRIDAASAQTQGRYQVLSYALGRLQRVGSSTQLSVSFNGQLASRNLDSSEKFSLGGISGVRAFPQGEASGDEGTKATLELRHSYSPNWQVTAFYDWGRVRINKNPFGPNASTTANSKTLGGVGVGLNATFERVQLKAALAWRTQCGTPTSLPAGAAKSPVVMVMASVGF